MSYPLSYMVAVVALVWLYCTRTRWAALRSSRGCALLFCDFEERHYRYRGATVRAWKRLVIACRRWSVLLLSLLGRDRRDEEICDAHRLLLRFVVWMIRALV